MVVRRNLVRLDGARFEPELTLELGFGASA
jgi:hypothetical protein